MSMAGQRLWLTCGRAVQRAPCAQQVVNVLLDQRRRVLREYLKAVTKNKTANAFMILRG